MLLTLNAWDIIIVGSFRFLGGFQAFNSDLEEDETALLASLSTLTTDDGLSCEEVIDIKACS